MAPKNKRNREVNDFLNEDTDLTAENYPLLEEIYKKGQRPFERAVHTKLREKFHQERLAKESATNIAKLVLQMLKSASNKDEAGVSFQRSGVSQTENTLKNRNEDNTPSSAKSKGSEVGSSGQTTAASTSNTPQLANLLMRFLGSSADDFTLADDEFRLMSSMQQQNRSMFEQLPSLLRGVFESIKTSRHTRAEQMPNPEFETMKWMYEHNPKGFLKYSVEERKAFMSQYEPPEEVKIREHEYSALLDSYEGDRKSFYAAPKELQEAFLLRFGQHSKKKETTSVPKPKKQADTLLSALKGGEGDDFPFDVDEQFSSNDDKNEAEGQGVRIDMLTRKHAFDPEMYKHIKDEDQAKEVASFVRSQIPYLATSNLVSKEQHMHASLFNVFQNMLIGLCQGGGLENEYVKKGFKAAMVRLFGEAHIASGGDPAATRKTVANFEKGDVPDFFHSGMISTAKTSRLESAASGKQFFREEDNAQQRGGRGSGSRGRGKGGGRGAGNPKSQ